ncbi:hypothetical protein EDB81DRAFT_914499 [Dactylonectria macrodidyma]|uniref:Uncharacterized protein n=1 Tax=Dactylonectria macrodidyma TaxID=307937 RepID=A0A9P9DKA2_9HYPO|nr:hypothetical protein EDB81DRAFT_914499 [Dactylonectria macrodidyma]
MSRKSCTSTMKMNEFEYDDETFQRYTGGGDLLIAISYFHSEHNPLFSLASLSTQSPTLSLSASKMSNDEEKVAFLRIGYTPNGYPLRVQAYIADLPLGGDIKRLTLRGPKIITTRNDDDHPGSVLAGNPVFDYQAGEIVWSCHGGPHSESPYNIVNVWRLGSHFSLESIEHTPLKANYLSASSLILENGGVASVGVAQKALLDDDAQTTITSARRVDNNKWTTFPFNTTSTASIGTGIQLFKPARAEIKYIYYLRVERPSSNIIHVDLVKDAKFPMLPTNDSIQWEHIEVDLGFEVHGQFTAMVLPDLEQKKNRLYIFEAHKMHQGICYAYIPLRNDGSIETSDGKLKASGKQNLKSRVGPLKVLESDKRLILLGEEWTGSQTKDRIFAYSGSIKKNGSAPDANEWTNVEVGFETTQDWHDDKRFSYSAVVVPGDYH